MPWSCATTRGLRIEHIEVVDRGVDAEIELAVILDLNASPAVGIQRDEVSGTLRRTGGAPSESGAEPPQPARTNEQRDGRER